MLSVELLLVELLLEFAALALLLEEEVLPEPADVEEACPTFRSPTRVQSAWRRTPAR